MDTTCWHTSEVINEMNRFYDSYKHDPVIGEHFNTFMQLLNLTNSPGSNLLDLGCGTALLSEYCKDHKYTGVDLTHIISGCARRNYPEHVFLQCDIEKDDLQWCNKYNVIVLNGVIDIMERPLFMLKKILRHARQYVIIHRQEITEAGETRAIQKGSYGGYTYHSIINRADFFETLENHNFYRVKELPLKFGDWENGGASFLLKKHE